MSSILVAGSLNMDVVNRVSEFPVPGETITGRGTAYHPGGKGANQAVAAVRSGSTVTMAGAVGLDANGQTLVESLKNSGIRTNGIIKNEALTGMAFITVNDSGENTIVLSPGSNGAFAPDDIREEIIQEADIVLLQNEIPWITNFAIMKRSVAYGSKVIYNPAPAHRVDPTVLSWIDTLILNETEAAVTTGLNIGNHQEAELAADQLITQGVKNVIITLGGNGSYYASHSGESLHMPSFKVEAVDTTAAGDTFIGAYASALHSGQSRLVALRFATAAAAIAVTRHGAQHSVPHKYEIETFLENHTSV
ncbi:ribokinase [Paenibacillus paeoniae]|uniref:Ribokinase n=1 Tax=Paenibacillus paeoniae TaxID=2292705 RepID=A0A371PJM5_9BACL|nr:ribokinase [Paenibacillus paeoniae]REK75869.1 ribokinase [Paenibacillus paeoniae]